MELPIILISIFGILVLAGIFLIIWIQLKPKPKQEPDQSILLFDQRLSDMAKVLDLKLSEANRVSTDSIRNQLSESKKLGDQFIRELTNITEKVTRVEEAGKQMSGFANQIQGFQKMLENPKRRGILGEYYLKTILDNVLPPENYQMQYSFKDGTIVDAVVFVKDKIIPIDSKYSLENYNRASDETDPLERERLEKVFREDLKKRIDETSKYVKTDEGTMDFAFMFIPHEAIYYDLLTTQTGAAKENLVDYAFKKHVIIVSPTSFLAYLQTVLQGLRALQIEESAKEIRKNVESLGKHLQSYDDYFKKLGGHLGTTVNFYNNAAKEFKKVDKDVFKITGQSLEIDTHLVEGPHSEDKD